MRPSKQTDRTGRWLTDGERLLVWEYPQAPDGDQIDLVEVMEIADGLIQHHRIWGWFGTALLTRGAVDNARQMGQRTGALGRRRAPSNLAMSAEYTALAAVEDGLHEGSLQHCFLSIKRQKAFGIARFRTVVPLLMKARAIA